MSGAIPLLPLYPLVAKTGSASTLLHWGNGSVMFCCLLLALPMSGGNATLMQRLIYLHSCTRVGTLIVATIYLQLIQNSYIFRSFTVLHCSHQHCVQPVASDVEVVGYL